MTPRFRRLAATLALVLLSAAFLLAFTVFAQAAETVPATDTVYLAEGFEGPFPPAFWDSTVVTASTTTANWSRETVGVNPAMAPRTGAGMVRFNSYNAPAPGAARLYTADFEVPDSSVASVEFWMSHDSHFSDKNDRVQMQVSTDSGGTFTNLGAAVSRYDAACTAACWKLHTFVLPTHAGQAVRLGFLGISHYGNHIYIDDIVVRRSPQPAFDFSYKTATASALMGSPISYTIVVTNSGDLTATAAYIDDPLPAGLTLATSPTCTAGACGYSAAGNAVTWTGSLGPNAGATIAFAAKTGAGVCGAVTNVATIGDLAAGTTKRVQASTQLLAALPVLEERFSGGVFPPAGWGTAHITGTATPHWTRETVGSSPTIWPHSEPAMARYHSYGISAGNATRLYSPVISLAGLTHPQLRFWMGMYSSSANDRVQVQISVDGGATYANLGAPFARHDPACATACWQERVVDLSAYAGQPRVRVALLGISAYGYNIFIDDITIAEPWYPCPYIAVGSASANVCLGSTRATRLPIYNGTPNAETISMSVSAGAWPAGLSPTSVTLAPHATDYVTLTVDVPWSVGFGATDTVTVTGTAQASAQTASGRVTNIASLAPSWEDVASAPKKVRSHAVVADGGYIYRIGGWDGVAGGVSAVVHRYDIAANTWTTMTSMSTAVQFIDAVALDGKIYVPGGNASGGYVPTLQIYDMALNSWSTGAAMPVARGRSAVVALNGKIYVIGGGTSTIGLNTVYVYDPGTNTWSSAANMSIGRARPAAGAIGGKIYVAGGYSTTGLTSVEVYNPALDSWSTLPSASLPAARVDAADAVIDDRYLVVAGGGATYDSNSPANTVLILDTQTNRWASLPNLLRAATRWEGDGDGRAFYVVGGTGTSSTPAFDGAGKLTLCPDCQMTFRYNDAEDVVQPGETLYLAGDFNGWHGTTVPLTPNAAGSVFSTTLILNRNTTGPNLSYEYRVGPEAGQLQTNNRIATLQTRATVNDYRKVVTGWANLESPAGMTISAGAASRPIYGQLFVQNLTNAPGAGRSLRAELGYGQSATPSTWTWAPMAFSGQVGNNDQFSGTLTPGVTGIFSYTTRYDGNWAREIPTRAGCMATWTARLSALPRRVS